MASARVGRARALRNCRVFPSFGPTLRTGPLQMHGVGSSLLPPSAELALADESSPIQYPPSLESWKAPRAQLGAVSIGGRSRVRRRAPKPEGRCARHSFGAQGSESEDEHRCHGLEIRSRFPSDVPGNSGLSRATPPRSTPRARSSALTH